MNASEHYREAERLLDLLDRFPSDVLAAPPAETLATAQVHATLALAAATKPGIDRDPSEFSCLEPSA